MRQRLSQDVHTTRDKDWLEKMYDLLYTKIMRKHKDVYRKDANGDLDVDNGDYWSSDEGDKDEVAVINDPTSKKEVAVSTPKTSSKADRKRTLESSSSTVPANVSANKRGKHGASTAGATVESDAKNGELTATRVLILAMIGDLSNRQSTSNDRRSQIKALTSAIRSALDSVDTECDS